MTKDELLALERPVTLSVEQARTTFTSGKQVREWASKHGIKLIQHKGFVEFA